MLQNTTAQFNEVLTKYALGLYEDNSDFAVVGQGAIPMIPTEVIAGTYKIWNAADFRRRYATRRAASTEFEKMNLKLKDVAYACEQFGYEIDIDDRQAKYITNALESASAKLFEDGLANFDVELAAKLTTTNFTNYYTGTTSGSSNLTESNLATGATFVKWSDKTNSTPINDVINAKTAVKSRLGVYPDSILISEDVFLALKSNAQILARMSSYTDKHITLEKIKEFFELKNIYVMRGSATSTNEGQATQTVGLISSAQALLYFRGNGGPFDPATIQIYYNTQTYGAGSDGIIIQSYRKENITSDCTRLVQDFTVLVSMADGGQLFSTVL